MDNVEIIKPFGPSILKAKIPKKIIYGLNEYIDKIIINKEKSVQLDFGNKLVGYVTQEFKLEKNFAKEIGWLDFLAQCTLTWIKNATNKKITKFNLLDSWVVRQFQNEYNPTHYHAGHISGAGFLKVPDTFGKFSQIEEKKNKPYSGGNLNLIHGSKMFLSESSIFIKPEVGNFYFFPHYLMHSVYPFKGTDQERRSISFNATIDEDIYNVYKD